MKGRTRAVGRSDGPHPVERPAAPIAARDAGMRAGEAGAAIAADRAGGPGGVNAAGATHAGSAMDPPGKTAPAAEVLDPKLGGACFPGIADLEAGRRIDERDIFSLLAFVDARPDCSDFRMVSILRTRCAYPELLSGDLLAAMKRSILGFRYWMDEAGEDSMCFWSENHQIIFASVEYLAGQLFPDEFFPAALVTGSEHRRRARERILRWLGWRWKYGFSEWHSNTYYEEDAAPLLLLSDFAEDPEIVRKAGIILDLLFLDMAMHSCGGFFAAASGRCYERQKKDPFAEDTLGIGDAIQGFDRAGGIDWSRLGSHIHLSKRYRIPEAIRAIGLDARPGVVRTSMGLDLREIRAEFGRPAGAGGGFHDTGEASGMKSSRAGKAVRGTREASGRETSRDAETAGDPRGFATRGTFLWGMEAFTTPESIGITMEMFRAWRLAHNAFLADLAILDRPAFRIPGLLPLAVRILNPVTRGVAIQRGDTYTYRTGECMLSTALRHHPGGFADQQHVWQAVFANGATIFATHPAEPPFPDPARALSPGAWVGNGILPDAVQEGAVHLSIFDLRVRRGFMERRRRLYTHAYVSVSRFDEVRLEGRHLVARTGGTYAALIGGAELRPNPGDPEEIIQDGPVCFWICELSGASDWLDSGGFEGFAAAIRSRRVECRVSGRYGIGRPRILYEGTRRLELVHRGPFLVDGAMVAPGCPRFDTPWGRAEGSPDRLEFACPGDSGELKRLVLDFAGGRRECT